MISLGLLSLFAATTATALTLPPMELMAGAAVSLAATAAVSARLQRPSSSSIQDRIQAASSGTEVAFRQAPTAPPPPPPMTPEMAERQAQRQREIRGRVDAMLEQARANVQEGLDEALQEGDADTAAEYRALLSKLAPLPDGVVRDADSSSKPDYKRWVDPTNLRT